MDLIIGLGIFGGAFAGAASALLLRRYMARRASRVIVCYRCGVTLGDSWLYMGLDYCRICQTVVSAMAWMIAAPGGPPFGFPGGPGYLRPPEHLKGTKHG